MSKYTREITQTLADEDQGYSISVDVYDVLRAFNVTDPAIQHAIKKLLCTGIRGHKDSRQDLEEAIQSIERALDVVKVEEKLAAFADESQPDTDDNPQGSLVCPWRFGDVIHHRAKPSDFDWTVTEVTPKGVECRAGDRGEVSMFVPVAFYGNYRLCDQVKADESPACSFKVGDVIWHREDVRGRSEIKWRVTGFTANSVQVVSDDVYRSPSHIERQVWHRYVKVDQAADKPTELPACPFKAGDIIRGIGEPNTSKWKVERVRSDRIDVITYDAQKYPGVIEYGCWHNYIKVDPIDGTPVDKPAATC